MARPSADSDDARECVRCGARAGADPLVAAPEGWMCGRCYAEAK